MAYGLKCKHCGRQESEHRRCAGSRCENIPHLRGYKKSVADCPGYQIRNSDRKEYDMRFELEWHERRGQERAAWGLYGAYVRQRVLDEKLEACDTEKERKEMLEEARRQNGSRLYIG